MYRLLIIPLLFILLTGCPTESDIPLSDFPEQKVDSNLKGNWRRIYDKPRADSNELVTILFKSDSVYKVRRKGKRHVGDQTLTETTWFEAHVTTVENHNFINLKKISIDGNGLADSLRKYYIAQIDIHPGPDGDTLISRVFDGQTTGSTGSFRKLFENYVNESGLTSYDKEFSGKYYKARRKKTVQQ